MDILKTVCLLAPLAITMAWPPARSAELHIRKTGDTLVDAEALTIVGSFGQPALDESPGFPRLILAFRPEQIKRKHLARPGDPP